MSLINLCKKLKKTFFVILIINCTCLVLISFSYQNDLQPAVAKYSRTPASLYGISSCWGYVTSFFKGKKKNDLIPIKEKIANYISLHGVKVPSHKLRANELEITLEALHSYIEMIGKDTVEILYIPDFPELGHLALRVGDEVYSMIGHFTYDSFNWYIRRYSKMQSRIYGLVFQVSKEELLGVKSYLKKRMDSVIPYSFFRNNCSHNACRPLKENGIINIPDILQLDPFLVAIFAARSKRMILKTVYNARYNTARTALNVRHVGKRAKIILPYATIMFCSVIGGIEVLYLIDWSKPNRTYNTSLILLKDFDGYERPEDFHNDWLHLLDKLIKNGEIYGYSKLQSFFRKKIIQYPHLKPKFQELRISLSGCEKKFEQYCGKEKNRRKLARFILMIIFSDLPHDDGRYTDKDVYKYYSNLLKNADSYKNVDVYNYYFNKIWKN